MRYQGVVLKSIKIVLHLGQFDGLEIQLNKKSYTCRLTCMDLWALRILYPSSGEFIWENGVILWVLLTKWRRLASSFGEMALSGELFLRNGVVLFFSFFFKKVRLFSPPEAVGGRISPQFANSRIFPKWKIRRFFDFFSFLRFWSLPMVNLPHWRCWDRIEIAMDNNNFLEKNTLKEKIMLNRNTTLFYLFFVKIRFSHTLKKKR